MPAKRRAGGSLRMGIDNEVYTVVVRLLENPDLEATVPGLWTAIQRSNSSLKRKPKRLIEDSLERVLEALAEEGGSDSEAAIDEQHSKTMPVSDANIMNRSLTTAWRADRPAGTPPLGPTTPAADEGSTSMVNGARVSESERKKKRKRGGEAERESRAVTPSVRFSDLGGMAKIVTQLKEMVLVPLTRPSIYSTLRLPLPRGILLHGPPGCGKTLLARACAAETGVPMIEILGPSVVSGMSGESEKQVREMFEEARKQAPCILFIDEIDVLAPKRESSQSQMEKRIVAQLLISMDTLEQDNKGEDHKPVIVFAATNRPDTLDPALRRGGRFDTEINMGVPNERTRAEILKALTKETPISPDVDFQTLARMTPGFVGADLRDLVGKAGAHAIKQYIAAMEAQLPPPTMQSHTALVRPQSSTNGTMMDIDTAQSEPGIELTTHTQSQEDGPEITSYRQLATRLRATNLPEPAGFETQSLSMSSFLTVLPAIVPSSKREGFATIPDTTWSNIGALRSVREELQLSIVDAIRQPERYAALGISAPAGVLLWGPPGCGKTLLAKAVANESKANFISVKGPELLNKFVGESERAVRTVFSRAQSSVPCVIFFDELDALVPRRDEAGSEASARVVNTLLTEMDGLGGSREGIFVIAATNRPDVVDDAMLRPGRLETLLYVGLPGGDERAEILCTLVSGRRGQSQGGTTNAGASAAKDNLAGGIASGWPNDEALTELAKDDALCAGFSGADLAAVVRRAAFRALRKGGSAPDLEDFAGACKEVQPSVSDLGRYEKLRKKFRV